MYCLVAECCKVQKLNIVLRRLQILNILISITPGKLTTLKKYLHIYILTNIGKTSRLKICFEFQVNQAFSKLAFEQLAHACIQCNIIFLLTKDVYVF